MNRNDIFSKFIQNPLLKKHLNMDDEKLMKLRLSSPSPNRLVDVIKTAILNLDENQSTDSIARKINQSFKRSII